MKRHCNENSGKQSCNQPIYKLSPDSQFEVNKMKSSQAIANFLRSQLLSDKNMFLILCSKDQMSFYFKLFQEVITNVDFFAALSTDHSLVIFLVSKSKNRIHGYDFWKFNSSLFSDPNYLRKTKNVTQIFHRNQNFIPNAQLQCKRLKHEIRKFTIKYFKNFAKERKENRTLLKNKLTDLEVT